MEVPYAVTGPYSTIPGRLPGASDPGLAFRATGHTHLGHFFHHLYNNRSVPDLAERIRLIVLSDEFDNIENSGVLELLYCRDWGYSRTSSGAAVAAEASLAGRPIPSKSPHPFTTLVEDLELTHFVSSAEEFKGLASPKLYADIVIALFHVCENLEMIFVPQSWLDNGASFRGLNFTKLKYFGCTEELEEVEAEREKQEATVERVE